jgi:hypothetical protein
MAYRVETLVLGNGERFPMLIVSETGMPDFYPTLYTSNSLRLLRTANSIVAVLRAIHVMYLAGKQMGIDFQSRMLEGKLLSIGEIERLSAEIRKSANELRREPDEQDAAFLAALDSQNVAKIKKTWTGSEFENPSSR